MAAYLPTSQASMPSSADSRSRVSVQANNYIGIDVGTGSARVCIINANGDIIGLASEGIGLWQPQQGFYVSIPFSCPSYALGPKLTVPISRNNPRLTSGGASAPLSTVPSARIISILTPFEELASTRHVRCAFSPLAMMSPFPSPAPTSKQIAT